MEREVTKREIIFAGVILAIMAILGILLYAPIHEAELDRKSVYNKAVKIEDTELFSYGMRTNIGNAFVFGELIALDPVTFDDVDGKYLYISREEERYTRHVRTVTKTKKVNGKTVTYKENKVYYSWDSVDFQEKQATKFTFLNIEFSAEKFNFPNATYLKTDKVSYDTRYVYYVIPHAINGSVFTELRDNTITNGTGFHQEMTNNELYDSMVQNYDAGSAIFVILWVILTIGVIAIFFYAENKWLE